MMGMDLSKKKVEEKTGLRKNKKIAESMNSRFQQRQFIIELNYLWSQDNREKGLKINGYKWMVGCFECRGCTIISKMF